jgi:vacuolar-type H+-ATPase subunit C/Vma6
MSRATRYGFILAKVYGIMARSYAGKNFRDVLHLKKLSELSDLLYPGERPEGDESQLPIDLEARIVTSGISSMTYVLDYLGEPVPILVHALRRLEYQNLKSMIRGMTGGVTREVRFWDLGRYAGLKLVEPKDRQKAIKDSPYAWVLPLIETMPLAQLENRIDQEYHVRFLQLAEALPPKDRTGVVRLARLSITLANITWALRLRFFFGMEWERARKLLIPQHGDTDRKALARIFEMQPDAAEEWRKWKYGWLLADQLNETFHAPDPVRAEIKAAQMLATRARQSFHQNPFTLGPLVAYFKLKEYETSILKTAVEALHLSLPEQEVMAIVGAR